MSKQSANDKESIRQLACQFLRVLTSGSVAEVMDLLSEDFVYWVAGSLPHSGTYDKERMQALLAGLPSVFDGPFTITPTGFTIDGNRIAVEAKSEARTTTGKEFRNEYHFLMEFRDRKLVLLKEYMDTALSAQVFGS
jgi:ketosteroid isomerase-like protein